MSQVDISIVSCIVSIMVMVPLVLWWDLLRDKDGQE